MEQKSLKKTKTGPLKSSPGFLKCMRNVYLFFKEEKEKGALNIPINSFVERTAVACGVGRGTLYNYAKKGLFDENPAIIQPKKKKKSKQIEQGSVNNTQGRKKETKVLDSSSVSPKKPKARSVEVQTDTTATISVSLLNNGIVGYAGKEEKNAQCRQEVGGPWAGGNSARRDIDYFTKTNIWQNIYSISSSDIPLSSTDLTPVRMGNCQPTSSDLAGPLI